MSSLKGRKLSIYVDCVSPYSWFGFTNIIKFRPFLEEHGVIVDIIPFFLGAARNAAGNPWTPTPKYYQAFQSQDTATTGTLLGLKVVKPKVFPISSLLAVRVAVWLKDHASPQAFEAAYSALSEGYWSKGINISTTDGISQALKDVLLPEEISQALEGAITLENKANVLDLTRSSGAFGAPWIVAVNVEGVRKEWFGNDRWDQVFHHLGVPYTPVRIVPVNEVQGKAYL